VNKRLEERGKWWELRKENKIKEMSHGKGSERHMTNNLFVLNPSEKIIKALNKMSNLFVLLIIQSMHLPKHAYF